MNTSKPVRVKGWIADSYVLEPFPSVIQGMEEKFVLKIHPEGGTYIFDLIEERVTQKKLEAFENRFEDPLLREMEYTNRYQDRLFDGAKIVFETLRKPSLTGNLKRVQHDEELLKSKRRKALEPFVKYVLDVYYNGVDDYGNQIEESSREEPFEQRWNRARAILLKSK